MRALLLGALAVALVVELLRLQVRAVSRLFMRAVGPLLRGSEQRRLSGATTLALAMTLVVLLAPARAALVALWAAAVGDASAAIVGRAVQAARGVSGGKSAVGSLALVLATAAGAAWLAGVPPTLALALGCAAGLAEWPRWPLDDNLRVATATAVAAVLLGVR